MIDNDFNLVKQQLLTSKLDCYTPNDRYIMFDDDTHYYVDGCSYSLTWYNIIKTFLDVDIPLSSIIVLHNGYGLLQELATLIPKQLQEQNCMPVVIDRRSSCWLSDTDCEFIKNFNKEKPVVNTINRHAVTMMGRPRVHRHIIQNYIKEKQLFNKIAMAYNNVS